MKLNLSPRFVTCAALALTLNGGCSKSSSPASGPIGAPSPVIALSEQPVGSFTATGSEQNHFDDRFQVGCAKPGSSDSHVTAIDPRLKIGQSSTRRIESHSPKSNYALAGKETLTSVKGNVVTYDGQVTESSDQSLAATGAVFTDTCTLTHYGSDQSDSFRFSCESTPSLAALPAEDDCYVQDNPSPVVRVHTEREGTFRLESGQVIHAYLIKDVRPGKIFCRTGDEPNAKVIGDGQSVETRIVTNDLPINAVVECGGENLFNFSQLTLVSGTTLRSYREEVKETSGF